MYYASGNLHPRLVKVADEALLQFQFMIGALQPARELINFPVALMNYFTYRGQGNKTEGLGNETPRAPLFTTGERAVCIRVGKFVESVGQR